MKEFTTDQIFYLLTRNSLSEAEFEGWVMRLGEQVAKAGMGAGVQQAKINVMELAHEFTLNKDSQSVALIYDFCDLIDKRIK